MPLRKIEKRPFVSREGGEECFGYKSYCTEGDFSHPADLMAHLRIYFN